MFRRLLNTSVMSNVAFIAPLVSTVTMTSVSTRTLYFITNAIVATTTDVYWRDNDYQACYSCYHP